MLSDRLLWMIEIMKILWSIFSSFCISQKKIRCPFDHVYYQKSFSVLKMAEKYVTVVKLQTSQKF